MNACLRLNTLRLAIVENLCERRFELVKYEFQGEHHEDFRDELDAGRELPQTR
jgi:hypothetical protein